MQPPYPLSTPVPAASLSISGVLQVEAMAQLGGIVMIDPAEAAQQNNFFFGGVDKVKWRKPVVPGDVLVGGRLGGGSVGSVEPTGGTSGSAWLVPRLRRRGERPGGAGSGAAESR